MNDEDRIDRKVTCRSCKFEIPICEEKLVADEDNLARLNCPKCGENLTIDLGIPGEEE
jgi:predicted RNA-binding Zn-ribbon protein involved in translation (DUF1610 family)